MTGTLSYKDEFSEARATIGNVEIAFRRAGTGPPLLLLHGFPQTNFMWHRIAPALAEHFTVISADLRGYGDSAKPASDANHMPYSKREMAKDVVGLMQQLGFERFQVAGHDRGARVAHRMARDHPDHVERLAVLDIAPTAAMFEGTDKRFATAYYHWFFLIQPEPLPERLIESCAEFFLDTKMRHWGRTQGAITDEAFAEYLRCFLAKGAIHAMCEDYRAAATIDLEHDAEDSGSRLAMPLLAVWGREGLVGTTYDVVGEWRRVADDVRGVEVPGGHYVAEEAPGETLEALLGFLAR